MNPAPDWKAGLARRVITPRQPMYLAGFAARNRPPEGVLHDLHAKALALEDAGGTRVVLVCADVIGLPAALCDDVSARVEKAHGLAREQLIFGASHTHSGPTIERVTPVMSQFDELHRARIHDYTQELGTVFCELIGEALNDLAPARLSCGRSIATFAVNRRESTPHGVINRCNPSGPSDHEVSVLHIGAPDGTPHGQTRAVLFNYACHTTTLGSDSYLFAGDWAGFAQLEIERLHPNANALFLMGCAADQNPLPRGTQTHAQTYGIQAAHAVERALQTLQPVNGTLRVAREIVSLGLAPHTREMFEGRARNVDDPRNPYLARHAAMMLRHYDENRALQSLDYPLQALARGEDFQLLALADEVVVDYALRFKSEDFKREVNAKNLMVAAYCNDIAGYIPSLRVLREGGYEAGDSAIYFGLPGPFDETVEDLICAAASRVLNAVTA